MLDEAKYIVWNKRTNRPKSFDVFYTEEEIKGIVLSPIENVVKVSDLTLRWKRVLKNRLESLN